VVKQISHAKTQRPATAGVRGRWTEEPVSPVVAEGTARAWKAGLTAEVAEGAEEGGKQGEGCRSWRTERLRGLEGNRSTQRRKGAKTQRGVDREVGVQCSAGSVGARVGVQRRDAEGRQAQRRRGDGSVSLVVNRDPRLP